MAIHLITAWSGKTEDESPLCGADKNAPDVWGHRTTMPGVVTCEPCKDKFRERHYRSWESACCTEFKDSFGVTRVCTRAANHPNPDIHVSHDPTGRETGRSPSLFEVVVGNVGTVYSGNDPNAAAETYASYCDLSGSGAGRAGNESVALIEDGEIVSEWPGQWRDEE